MCPYQQLSLFDRPPAEPEPAPAPAAPALTPQSSLNAAISAYHAHLAGRGLAPASLQAMQRDLQVAGNILGLARQLDSLTRADLERLVKELQATSKPNTVERRMNTVRAFVEWLGQQGAAAGRLHYVSFPRAQQTLPAVLSRDQVARLLEFTAALEDPRPALLVHLALATGMKRADLTRLCVYDLSLETDPPTVRVGNTPRSTRTIRVPAAVAPIYRAYCKRYAPVERVFSVTERQLDNILDAVANDLGLSITFGMLRWTAALRDLQAGMSPDRLRLKLGLSPQTWPETLTTLKRLAL